MSILSSSDIREISNAWVARQDAAFNDAIETRFVNLLLSKVPHDLKYRLMLAANMADCPGDIRVAFGDARFSLTDTLRAEGWGTRTMTISAAIFNTDALFRVARAIGDNVHVQHHFTDEAIFFTIEFYPSSKKIDDPEEQYADMPTLET